MYVHTNVQHVISGGYNDDTLHSTEIYHTVTDSFASNPPVLPIGVYEHCMAKWNAENKLYIVGGVTNSGFEASTHIFDIENRTFSTLSSQMNTPRYSRGCTIMEQERKLVMPGEISLDWYQTQTVEILDLNTHTWSFASDIPFTSGFVPISVDGNLFVLRQDGFFYQFDSSNDAWKLLSETSPFDGDISGQFLVIDANVALICQYL